MSVRSYALTVMAMTFREEEKAMDRNDLHQDLIDLGVASLETKGASDRFLDTEGGKLPVTGLTDD